MKRHKTVTQMRAKEETTENQLSDQEILSLQGKDLSLLMLKMMQDVGHKLEAKTDNLQETLTKEIQDRKREQEEMQNTIPEIKNSLDAANSRIREAEEEISKVEDRRVEITDREQKREKRLKTNEESLRELWDHVKRTNIRIIGVPEGEEREKGTEKILKETIAKNFPNMGKEPLTQIQEAQRLPYKINPRRHILTQRTKIKDREKILKAAREKKQITDKGTPIRLSADFSAETLQPRREWHDTLNVMKGKNRQPRLLSPARLSCRFQGEIKSFTDKQRLREFSNTKPALQQILKELLQAEEKRPQQETKIPQMTRLTSQGIHTVKIQNHPRTIRPPKSDILRRAAYKCRTLEMHLQLRDPQLKTISYRERLLYQNFRISANQTSTTDTQKNKKHQLKCNTKDSHQTTRGENKKGRKKSNTNKSKAINKMAIRTYISIITRNVNRLNAPTKRHRPAECIQKQDPYICCLPETHFTSRTHTN
uniref:L1 transposable element RRM domain-containing protein n=1 Tax=Sus scrofa TaxID=9823 RepID=A0A4X1SZP2_PIG